LAYSHPLGLVMDATLALAGLAGARVCFGGYRPWLLVHGLALVLILPWVKNYFDHPPEFLSGHQPLRFLLGVPIAFIGGDSRVLAGLLLLIVVGLWRHGQPAGKEPEPDAAFAQWLGPVLLLLWLVAPPTVLYAYSLVSYPIFGPARYTAFVAPPYLILAAGGLRRLPALLRYALASLLAIISALALGPLAFDPELRADWRAFAHTVSARLRDRRGDRISIIVASSDRLRNVEVETARYYLPENCTVIGAEDAGAEKLREAAGTEAYFAVGLRHGDPVAAVPNRLGGYEFQKGERYPGLAVFRGSR
jgi:hypothetical protein